MAEGAQSGSLSGTASAALVANVNIEYANGFVQNEQFGITTANFTEIPSTIEANKKITIRSDIKPVSGNVVIQGANDMDQTPGGDRGFGSIRYDMLRITKGDVF